MYISTFTRPTSVTRSRRLNRPQGSSFVSYWDL